MDQMTANEIFEKYNPANGVVRCPNGRARIRKPLDTYAQASVNLYGIIKLEEFVTIFNSFHEDQTSVEEVHNLLLPNIIKFRSYGFYKDYIVHRDVLPDFDRVEYLERAQANKPRYLPAKEQFELYSMEDYDDNNHWSNVYLFMRDTFGNHKDLITAYFEIRYLITYNHAFHKLGPILKKYHFAFHNEERLRKFMELLTIAQNNTRIWENKGHTPDEILKLSEGKPREMVRRKPASNALNDSCPCGSGKKYKNCCYLIEKRGFACLQNHERKRFYGTWIKLLNYVNQKLNVVDYRFDMTNPDQSNQSLFHQIREKLWENPHLIGEYIRNDDTLSREEVHLLQSWEKHFLKGQFVVLKYERDYAVFMRMDKGEAAKLYAVKGITNSIGETISSELPTMLETVLLPFGDKIIYDSFFMIHSIGFGSGMVKMFQDEYSQSMGTYGIIRKLQ